MRRGWKRRQDLDIARSLTSVTNPPMTVKGWLRYDAVTRLLAELHGVESVLEVGAGEGALGVRLARHYQYVGLEPDKLSFEAARQRFAEAHVETVLNGGLEALWPGAVFDLVCAFEVLEHCKDDAATLRDWASFVRPGGWLMLSVPAFARRFGPSDRKAGHYRRYEPGQVLAGLDAAGLQPLSVELYGYPLGNLLEMAWNTAARLRPAKSSTAERTAASGRYLQPKGGLGWLTRGVSAPGRIAQRSFIGKGRGTGFLALAQRV